MYRRLWRYRSLLLTMVKRQYQLRYRQSLVGFAWAIFPPIASLLVATLVFHTVIGVETGSDVSYPLFTLAGLAPWTFFTSAVSSGVPSVVGSIQLVTRFSFPRAVLPISFLGTALIDLALTAGIFIAYVLVTGEGIKLTALLFPILLAVEIVLATGIILLGSALNTFARDIRLAVPMVMQLWLFLTPVMYPLTTVPDSLRAFYLANPMTGVIENFRLILVFGKPLDWSLLMPSVIAAVGLLLIGSWYFSSVEDRFADVI
ncbi:MAG TPA: ABC transporter permease [Actinomycetota bacterium]|nr:ABC transporter permease [Actinomycetota bacterium]